MSIHIILISEDLLSDTVAKTMLKETRKNYEVVNFLYWNKDKIRKQTKEFNKSARGCSYLVLTDQDTKDRCPPDAIRELSVPVHPNLLYRFAVMEIESWVMAHRDAISKFLSVPLGKIPQEPDTVNQPKEYLVNLARKSRSKIIREAIAPRANSTSKVGPDYNGRLGEFVSNHWDVNIAAQISPSLKRTFARLQQFTPIPYPE